MDIDLVGGTLAATVSTQGGVIWRLEELEAGRRVPLLRLPPAGADRNPLQAACFPLVPFGNRIAGNRFVFEEAMHELGPNMTGESHVLHGDGWLGEWTVGRRSAHEVSLFYEHKSRHSPFCYRAEQDVALVDGRLMLTMRVTNQGSAPLPYGFGWHPYFPLTPQTKLQAPAASWWTEGQGHLPDSNQPVPASLDFTLPQGLPRRWINNGFEGWDGMARIIWPELGREMVLEADARFSRYFLFVSDPAFQAGYGYDFFCFEPMTHSANAHNFPGEGGLVRLAPGESFAGAIKLAWRRFDAGEAPAQAG